MINPGNPQTVQSIVRHFNLQPHPEGGYFREVYRSAGVIGEASLPGYHGERNFCTSIYFLITSGNFSGFHRIRQDEIWHFYAGSPLHVHVIDPGGQYICHTIGNQIENGQEPQLVVRGGNWFASGVAETGAFSFVGCTVAPGFDFRDFELARREELTMMFPVHAEVIRQFTRQ